MLYGIVPIGGISFNPKTDIPDLSGKVILITGGKSLSYSQFLYLTTPIHLPTYLPTYIYLPSNHHHPPANSHSSATGNIGLGKETILQLSAHNPSRIYLAARTQSKAETAIADIQSQVPDAPIKFLPCDLTSLASVQACARAFVALESRLDILYLNAGVMALPPGQTQEGYEIQFGTNHVGHALLTKLLLPTLLKTAQGSSSPPAEDSGEVHSAAAARDDVRIISVASIGHTVVSGLDFDALKTDMSASSTWTRYGQSKLANILLARELARRHPSLTAVSVHPGFVDTGLYVSHFKSLGPLEWAAYKVKNLVWTSVQDGAKTQLWAGTAAKEVEKETGGKEKEEDGGKAKGKGKGKGVKSGTYYTPIGVTGQGTKASEKDDLAEKLWTWTEKELEGWEL